MKIFKFQVEDQKELLQYSRYCLEEEMGVAEKIFPLTPEFMNKYDERHGLFVSLYLKNNLRACLGQMSSDIPLYKALKQMTIASVRRDYRFKSISTKEVRKLAIEISLISPMRKIDSISEIELGRHGIYIESNGKTGTFLPQVATDNVWNLEEFLGYCSDTKVGIGWEGWKSAKLFIYETMVFKEGEE